MLVCPRCGVLFRGGASACPLDGALPVETERDPFLGCQIGQYQIVDRIGAGAMGNVYRARHAVIDRQYAIKMLYGDVAAEENDVKRFRREAQVISKIDHPNVIAVQDFGRTAHGLSYLVMELVEGRQLSAHIRGVGAFGAVRAATIARQIASGLAAVHHMGFVHRDLKPGNVMIVEREDVDVVKILDFGLVGIVAQRDEVTKLTRPGLTLGTPRYMAPEQFLDASVGPGADLYALGVILYEMVAGQAPFNGDTKALINGHLREAPPPLLDGSGLSAIAMRLLAKLPQDRFADADSVIQALDDTNLVTAGTLQGLQDVILETVTRPAMALAGADELTADSRFAESALAPTYVRPQTPGAPSAAARSRWRPLERFAGGVLLMAVVILAAALLSSPRRDSGAGDVASASEVVLEAKPVSVVARSVEARQPELTEVGPQPGLTEPKGAVVEATGQPGLTPPNRPEPARAARTRAKQAPAPAAQPEPAESPPAMGFLYVVTRQAGAPLPTEVFVGGRSRGESPLRLELPTGEHEVRVGGPQGPLRKVMVESSNAARLVIDLE